MIFVIRILHCAVIRNFQSTVMKTSFENLKKTKTGLYIHVLKNMLTSISSLRDLFSINVNFLQVILVSFPFGDNVISTHIFCLETHCCFVKF